MAVEATTSPFPPRLPAWQQPDIARANSCLEKRKFNETLSEPILASPLGGHHCPWVLLAQSNAPPGVGVCQTYQCRAPKSLFCYGFMVVYTWPNV